MGNHWNLVGGGSIMLFFWYSLPFFVTFNKCGMYTALSCSLAVRMHGKNFYFSQVINSNAVPVISMKDENRLRNSQGLGDRDIDNHVLASSSALPGLRWWPQTKGSACYFGWWPDHPWALGWQTVWQSCCPNRKTAFLFSFSSLLLPSPSLPSPSLTFFFPSSNSSSFSSSF